MTSSHVRLSSPGTTKQSLSKRPTRRNRPAILSGEAGLLRVIEKTVLNRHVDAPKLKELLEMHGHLVRSRARASFVEALATLQTELPVLAERGMIELKDGRTYTYALWEDIGEIITPILARHGFVLMFRVQRDKEGVSVTGNLGHRDGHSEESCLHLPADLSGQKNAVQAVGSSVSYGKRYVAQALLNLVSRGEDDDGTKAVSETPLADDQLAELEEIIDRTSADRERLLAYLEIQSLDCLPAARFEAAKAALLVREAAQ